MTDLANVEIGVDTRGLKDADREMQKLGTTGDRTERKLNKATTGMNNGFMSVKKTLGLVGGALAAVGAARLADELIDYSDAWKSVNNQLRQVSESEDQLKKVRSDLLVVTKDTNTELGATVNLYSELYRSTRDLNVSQERVLGVTKTINNLFKAGGKTVAETAGAVRQLAQGLAAGALRGDEFNSVAEGAPRIMDALARKLKMTRGELRDFAADGGITTQIMVEALEDYRDEAQKMADQTEETFGMKMTNAKTNVLEFVGSLNSLNTIVDKIGNGILGLTERLNDLDGPSADNIEAQILRLQAALDGGPSIGRGRNRSSSSAIEERLANLREELLLTKALGGDFDALTTVISNLEEEIAAIEGASSGKRGRNRASSQNRLASLNRQLDELNKMRMDSLLIPEELLNRQAMVFPSGKKDKSAEKALREYERSLERVLDRIDPAAAKVRDLTAEWRLLNKAIAAGDASLSDRDKWLQDAIMIDVDTREDGYMKRRMEEGRDIMLSVETEVEKYNRLLDDLQGRLDDGTVSQETFNRAVKKLDDDLKGADEFSKRVKTLGEDIDDSLLTGISNAIGGVEDWEEQFIASISRILIELAVLKAAQSFGLDVSSKTGGLGSSIVGAFLGGGASSYDGGGYTGSGPRVGGLDGKGGFLALMHPQEEVIDHTKSQKASTSKTVRPLTVNQTINVSGRPDNRTANQIANESTRRQRQAQARFGA